MRTLALLASAITATWVSMDTARATEGCATTQGRPCTSTPQCESWKGEASLCIRDLAGDGRCQVPCNALDDLGSVIGRDPTQCALGETCIAGELADGAYQYYCRPSSFMMDLNLLDACLQRFVDGPDPTLSDNDCSLIRNLDAMLERDNDGRFTIFDVDACIRDFLEQQACTLADPTTGLCTDGSLHCTEDEDCGEGLYCHPDFSRCERECGFIVDREDSNERRITERICAGNLSYCNLGRGRCEPVSLDGLSCSIDRDCPSGAYCFLGRCAPSCYRSIDCPGADWFCGRANTCQPRPPETAGGEVFVPSRYALSFARTTLDLNAIVDEAQVPVVIMDTATRKQVFDQDNAVFAYRLEVAYGRKQAPQCLGDLNDAHVPQSVKEDCVIQQDQGEAWLTLDTPFGTIYGTGTPRLGFRVNPAAFDALTPGYYPATVTAIFSNGRTTNLRVLLHKPSPSGLFRGQVSVYVNNTSNHLLTTGVATTLWVDKSQRWVWDTDVLAANNLSEDRELIDINEGFAVKGVIHANDSLMFDQPTATHAGDNLIPVKGIYSKSAGRMRLIAVTEISPEQQWCRRGRCDPSQPDEIVIANPFGRRVRRIIELIGPFDAAQRSFEGMYRETLQGLLPDDFTFDGGFRLVQSEQHDTFDHESLLASPLLASPGAVAFPSLEAVRTQLHADIDASCGSSPTPEACEPNETCPFSDAAALTDYLRGEDFPIFDAMTSFKGEVKSALRALGDSQVLTLGDFFRDQVGFCDAEPQPTACISEPDAACGLALYRLALLERGWVDLAAAASEVRDALGGNTPPLFCDAASETQAPVCEGLLGAGPNVLGTAAPTVRALLEHNRFYSQLTSAHNFAAGSAVGDAFFALFRTQEAGDIFGAATAYAYKDAKLAEAVFHYDRARSVLLSPAATAVLYAWPVDAFDSAGRLWLDQAHATLNDRMDALTDLFDLKRRMLADSLLNDPLFVNHLLHVEYLAQLFLAGIQERWQGERMAYAGEAPAILEKGNLLLAKVSGSRNPLGLYPNRTYFENDDLSALNWEHFQANIRQGRAYSIDRVRALIDAARNALEESLRQEQDLAERLQVERHQIDATLDDLCGDEDTGLPPACDVSFDQKQLATQCVGEGCLTEFQCDGPECNTVVQVFSDSASSSLEQVACRTDTTTYRITYRDAAADGASGQGDIHSRLCVRGRVGALSQEKVVLELQRKHIIDQVQNLVREIGNKQGYIRELTKAYGELSSFLEDHYLEIRDIDQNLRLAEQEYQSARNAAEAADCWIIGGTANGTNCPQKVALGAAVDGAMRIKNGATSHLDESRSQAQEEREHWMNDFQMNREIAGVKEAIDQLVMQVQSHVADYTLNVQQAFNLDMEIRNTLYQAQRHADRYGERIGQVVDHLVGSLRVSPMVHNRYVREANSQFQRLLLETYKMTQAYIHYYNLEGALAENLRDALFTLMTVDDVESFIDAINQEKDLYYSSIGIDPDTLNNTRVAAFSLRKLLFPNLRRRVDPDTGRILSAGEQFHNIVTAPPYLTKVVSAGGNVTQRIEIPFSIWMDDRYAKGTSPTPRLFPADQCNHVLAAGPNEKTIGLQAFVTNAEQQTELYVLVGRGATDHVRSCTEYDPQGYKKVRAYQVGNSYWEEREQGSDGPFVVQPAGHYACVEDGQASAGDTPPAPCWLNFARDRALGDPDWKLSIPELETGGVNAWIFEEADDGPRTLDDIYVFLRYSSVTIANMTEH